MLNKNGERELAYLVQISNITPMNADRLECVHIGGWHCVAGKGEFQIGDPAVYFEIDSKLPEKQPFSSMEFLVSKHYKIKSQKIRGEISQGLLMPVTAFGWEIQTDGGVYIPEDGTHYFTDESRFLTKKLEVTYATPEDNQRKDRGTNKYKRMAQLHPKAAQTRIWKWLWRFAWGKKLLFIFFGGKKVKRTEWPAWVKKTDEERCQNMPWLFDDNKTEWIVTEKIDGTSTTFTMKGFGRKRQFCVCSRNVVFDKPDKKCFYDTNVYLEMAQKYDIENKLDIMMDTFREYGIDYITIQGETYGNGVQKRDYGLTGHDFAAFNLIFGYKNGRVVRKNSVIMKDILDTFHIPCVPILANHYRLPSSCEEMLKYAEGKSVIDGEMREGVVLRSIDGVQSFKAVSNPFLLKYHN